MNKRQRKNYLEPVVCYCDRCKGDFVILVALHEGVLVPSCPHCGILNGRDASLTVATATASGEPARMKVQVRRL